MPDNNFDKGLLVAYADNQLGADDMATVEAAISADPSLRAQVDIFKRSGELLKSAVNIENCVTPEHVVFRIGEIEAAAKNKRQRAFEASSSTPLISWQFLSSIGGSFAAGLACSVFVISPGLMTASNDQWPPAPDEFTDQIVMRGVGQFQVPYLDQKGINVKSGGTLRAGIPFKIALQSPMEGRYSIQEILPESGSCRPVEPPKSSQGCMEFGGGAVTEGLDITSDEFRVDEQETLHLRVKISNNVTTIHHDLVFEVQ